MSSSCRVLHSPHISANLGSAVRCATLVLISCAAGCGGGSTQVSITGNVSYRDAPITSGTLTFFPSAGRPATAVIDQGGQYACELKPGRHRVTVTVGVDVPAGWQEGDPLPRQKLILPPRYGSRKKTPLSVDVAVGHTGPLNFSLQ